MALERVKARLALGIVAVGLHRLERASTAIKNTAAIVSVHIERLEDLHASYMPFLKRGGLFIPFSGGGKSSENHITMLAMQDDVCLLLRLVDDSEVKLCLTEVAWISPNQGQGRKTGGVGLHFSSQTSEIKSHIDALLQGSVAIAARTQTL